LLTHKLVDNSTAATAVNKAWEDLKDLEAEGLLED
jgi:hypothetical protein